MSSVSSTTNFESVMATLQEYHQQISAMTLDTYDRQVLLDGLNIVDDLVPFTHYQRRQGIAIMFKILSTTAGVFFLGMHKSLCVVFLEKVEECMEVMDDSEHELRDIIAAFTDANIEVFCSHGIDFTNYFRDGYGNKMSLLYESEDDDYEEDYHEEDDDYEEDYHEYDYNEPEYEQHYSDEDDDDDFDEQQLELEMMAQEQELLAEVHAQEEDYERKEQEKILQNWKNKMVIVHDHLLRRNDPFYSACINSQIKKSEIVREQEFEKQITALTTIIRNELRNSETEDIDEEGVFKVDSNLVENLLECKVDNEMSKIFGCAVNIRYTKNGMGGKCEVFDGTYTHELDTFANVSVMISTLKKEMISECLYDTELVCRDVAGLITTFI